MQPHEPFNDDDWPDDEPDLTTRLGIKWAISQGLLREALQQVVLMVARTKRLTETAYRMVPILVERTDPQTGTCTISMDQLAGELDVSKQALREARARLESADILVVDRNAGRGGCNVFLFDLRCVRPRPVASTSTRNPNSYAGSANRSTTPARPHHREQGLAYPRETNDAATLIQNRYGATFLAPRSPIPTGDRDERLV